MKRPATEPPPTGHEGLVEAIGLAVAFHQRGDLVEAQRRYRAILAVEPGQFDVLHCLGALEAQQGHLEEARHLLGRAVKSNPVSAEAHLNLGNVFKALARSDEALASYERALAVKSDYAEVFNNRGNVMHELRRYAEALASYDKAVAVKPDYADAYFNRGVVLQELGRREEALTSYERALAIQPDSAEAYTHRGNVLQDLQRHAEALASYERALAIAPDFAPALNNRGNVLRDLRCYDEALASYQKALTIEPDYADAYFNLGVFFQGLNRHEEAIRDFEQVMKLDPSSSECTDTSGNLLSSKMCLCDWRQYDQEVERVVAGVRAGQCSIPPFPFLAISGSAQDQLSCSRIWSRDKFPVSLFPVWKGERYHHDRIRVAYLSTDFRDHAVAYLMAGLFEQHDRTRFEITAVSFGVDTPGETRTRLKGAFEHFIVIGKESDREIAELLRQREIDIAVDLNGYTLGNRTGIFALRPVPVQVSYLGYPGTLGAGYIDYMLTDRHTIPEGREACYAEKTVCLPETFQANDSKRRIAEHSMTRAEAGLPENGFVFCCFNNNYKITPAVFDVWMRLLDKVEASVLWLIHGHALMETNLRHEAELRGINPTRLIFAPRLQYAEHLARYRLADIFLDTLPFNAGTTASDALWGGLPVLTCMGDAFAARMAGGLLHAIGLPELITHSLQEYQALALQLATDGRMLADIKARLAYNRETCPLFNTDRFRRHIEAAYLKMWERCRRGELPVSFVVEPIT